jgi:predicted RNase H-like HicB family nuclease
MKRLSLKSLVWKERKYYVSQALNVDVSSFGKTKKEAIKNLLEAASLYLEGSRKIELKKVSNPSIVTNTVVYA